MDTVVVDSLGRASSSTGVPKPILTKPCLNTVFILDSVINEEKAVENSQSRKEFNFFKGYIQQG